MYADPNINSRILTAVGKVIIAIAWADGEIQHQEVECLRALLSELPDIPAERLDALECLLQRPIEPTEREVIIDEFENLITGHNERNFALYWLDRIIDAKGRRDPQEMKVYESVVSRFIKRQAESPMGFAETYDYDAEAPVNHDHAVLVEERMEGILLAARALVPQDLIPDEILRRVLLYGALAARITRADYRIDESEVAQLRDFLLRETGLSVEQGMQLARLILVRQIEEDVEVQQLCVELRERASMEERSRLLDHLICISEQDGIVVDGEMNQIISMAAVMGIDQIDFEEKLDSMAEMLQSA